MAMNETVIEGGIGDVWENEVHATLVTSEAESDRFDPDDLDEQTLAFVDATTFPQAVLLVAQKELASISLQLRLEWVVAEEETLVARVDAIRESVLNAHANETIIARLQLGETRVPTGGRVKFLDYSEDELHDVEIA